MALASILAQAAAQALILGAVQIMLPEPVAVQGWSVMAMEHVLQLVVVTYTIMNVGIPVPAVLVAIRYALATGEALVVASTSVAMYANIFTPLETPYAIASTIIPHPISVPTP